MTQKTIKEYSKRIWLNPNNSASTGSVVAFNGLTKWHKGEGELFTYLEISDCHGKIKLHRTHDDTMDAFIKKMRLLSGVISKFADFLESNSNINYGT